MHLPVTLFQQALAAPLKAVPFNLQQTLLSVLLNHALSTAITAGGLDFLEGRTLVLDISDLGWHWPISLRDGQLVIETGTCPPDAVIRGAALEFYAVAVRRTDPDTLFFQRRLIIEGDTELALAVKNFLDGIDPSQLPLPMQIASHGLATFRQYSAGIGHKLGLKRV
ncbi:MAG: SCP2 sterol-binding domain-containing protein [Gammaproteobacteria bacterium]|jgi:predicted lipid carrier protein YhbT|nr:SCP2 sterol-binding domain-containing protein [Gammaproteobacteria bacterium]